MMDSVSCSLCFDSPPSLFTADLQQGLLSAVANALRKERDTRAALNPMPLASENVLNFVQVL